MYVKDIIDMIAKFISYIDTTGKKKLRINEEWVKRKNEEDEERKNSHKEEIKKLKGHHNYWFGRWLLCRKVRRQKRFVGWLRDVVPEERWKLYGEKTVERFVSKVDVKDIDECWEWLASTVRGGYGAFFWDEKDGKSHRFIYVLIHGEIPKNKSNICHRCNNPRCVNPSHLFACTQKENSRQREDEGRSNHVKGENHGRVKLTQKEVDEIRELWKTNKYTQPQISKIFNVSRSAIKHIVNNETWENKEYQKWVDNKYKK